ncbi:DMT family transporter [Nocardia sp. NRRL S-836]|uniref:DMT family transporter n=1 Tax=Nocardia sp. NRRL S-836 TaxID=1519492 RepID=UPI0006AE893A|nr:DMT family transporter [Nocardia sp. NRRL S-836]
MYFALLAAALLVGCLLAVQASVNLQLNKAVGTPYGASTLQLSVATALLAVLAVAVGTIGAVGLVPDVEPWHLLGGLASPLYITSGILLFPRLGALAAVGLFVTGQMFASLALDLFGLFGVPRQPLTIGIAVGAIAVLAGITVIIRGQLKAQKAVAPAPAAAPAGGGTATATKAATGTGVKQAGWIVLGIVAGAVLPIQGAVNAKLRADLKAPITVAMISFIVATLAIAVVLLVMRALNRTPAPKLAPLRTMPWWGWLGGACAAAYVTATFMLIPEIGAATTVALTVTGQQLASALIDSRGLFQMPRRPFTSVRITGLALLVVGSALVQLT